MLESYLKSTEYLDPNRPTACCYGSLPTQIYNKVNTIFDNLAIIAKFPMYYLHFIMVYNSSFYILVYLRSTLILLKLLTYPMFSYCRL